jgi:hypothetical protein
MKVRVNYTRRMDRARTVQTQRIKAACGRGWAEANSYYLRGSGQQTNTWREASGVALARLVTPVKRIIGRCPRRLKMAIFVSLAPIQPFYAVERLRRHAY